MWRVSIIRGPIKAGEGGGGGSLVHLSSVKGGHGGSDQSPMPPSLEQQPVIQAWMRCDRALDQRQSWFVSAPFFFSLKGASFSFRFQGCEDQCRVASQHSHSGTH